MQLSSASLVSFPGQPRCPCGVRLDSGRAGWVHGDYWYWIDRSIICPRPRSAMHGGAYARPWGRAGSGTGQEGRRPGAQPI